MKDNLIEKTHLKEGEVVESVENEYDIGNNEFPFIRLILLLLS